MFDLSFVGSGVNMPSLDFEDIITSLVPGSTDPNRGFVEDISFGVFFARTITCWWVIMSVNYALVRAGRLKHIGLRVRGRWRTPLSELRLPLNDPLTYGWSPD